MNSGRDATLVGSGNDLEVDGPSLCWDEVLINALTVHIKYWEELVRLPD